MTNSCTSPSNSSSICHSASRPSHLPSSGFNGTLLLCTQTFHSSYSSASAIVCQQQSGSADAPAAAATATEAAVDPVVEAAKEVTRAIRAATEPQQLLRLVQQHSADLSHIHVSAVFTAARRMCAQDGSMQQAPGMQQLLRQLPALAEGVKQQCRGRELGDIMLASARLQLPNVVMALLPALLQQGVLQGADAISICSALRSLGQLAEAFGKPAAVPGPTEVQLQQLLAALLSKADGADSRKEVKMGLWAIETLLKHQMSTQQLQQRVSKLTIVCPHYTSCVLGAAAQAMVQVQADQLRPLIGRLLRQQADASSIARALHACAISNWQPAGHDLGLLLTRFAGQLPDVGVPDTNRLLWAVSCFGGPALPAQIHSLQHIWDHMLSQLPHASPLALWTTLLVAVSTQLHMPEHYVQQALDELQRRLPSCRPNLVSGALRCAAILGHPVPGEQLDAFIHRLLESLHEAKRQDIAAALWALEVLHQQVPAEYTKPLLARLQELKSQGDV